MSETKLGDIYLIDDKGERRAICRPTDGAPDVFLCAINSQVYNNHPALRETFVQLAADVAVNLSRPEGWTRTAQRAPTTTSADVALDRTGYPCWTCTSERAVDARHWLRAFSDEDLARQLSPAGTPFFCCRVI